MFLLHMWFHLMNFMYKRSVLLLPSMWLKSHQFGLPHMSLYLNGLFVICYFIFDRLVVKLSSCWRTIAGAGDHGYHKDVASHYNSFLTYL